MNSIFSVIGFFMSGTLDQEDIHWIPKQEIYILVPFQFRLSNLSSSTSFAGLTLEIWVSDSHLLPLQWLFLTFGSSPLDWVSKIDEEKDEVKTIFLRRVDIGLALFSVGFQKTVFSRGLISTLEKKVFFKRECLFGVKSPKVTFLVHWPPKVFFMVKSPIKY